MKTKTTSPSMDQSRTRLTIAVCILHALHLLLIRERPDNRQRPLEQLTVRPPPEQRIGLAQTSCETKNQAGSLCLFAGVLAYFKSGWPSRLRCLLCLNGGLTLCCARWTAKQQRRAKKNFRRSCHFAAPNKSCCGVALIEPHVTCETSTSPRNNSTSFCWAVKTQMRIGDSLCCRIVFPIILLAGIYRAKEYLNYSSISLQAALCRANVISFFYLLAFLALNIWSPHLYSHKRSNQLPSIGLWWPKISPSRFYYSTVLRN